MTTYRPEQAQDYLQCLVALYSARARHAWLANPPPPPVSIGGRRTRYSTTAATVEGNLQNPIRAFMV
jgi:hypothetical protein